MCSFVLENMEQDCNEFKLRITVGTIQRLDCIGFNHPWSACTIFFAKILLDVPFRLLLGSRGHAFNKWKTCGQNFSYECSCNNLNKFTRYDAYECKCQFLAALWMDTLASCRTWKIPTVSGTRLWFVLCRCAICVEWLCRWQLFCKASTWTKVSFRKSRNLKSTLALWTDQEANRLHQF